MESLCHTHRSCMHYFQPLLWGRYSIVLVCAESRSGKRTWSRYRLKGTVPHRERRKVPTAAFLCLWHVFHPRRISGEVIRATWTRVEQHETRYAPSEVFWQSFFMELFKQWASLLSDRHENVRRSRPRDSSPLKRVIPGREEQEKST